jgi:transcriptional regulator with XRE-family HTH domain
MHSGTIIREAREALDLTQEQLGELAGVDHSTISRIENGLIASPPRTIKALTDALGQEKARQEAAA